MILPRNCIRKPKKTNILFAKYGWGYPKAQLGRWPDHEKAESRESCAPFIAYFAVSGRMSILCPIQNAKYAF
jgi:hypothetical protein